MNSWNINDLMVCANITKQTLVDSVDANTTYVWESLPWFWTSDPNWALKRILVDGTLTTISFPIGSSDFPSTNPEFVWDDRAEYNYSLTPIVTLPTLTTVSIASNNIDPTVANVGDNVTITLVATQFIRSPLVTIDGKSAAVTRGVDDLHWTAAYMMTDLDTQGILPFTIDFKDIGGVSGTTVIATTDSSAVTFTIL